MTIRYRLVLAVCLTLGWSVLGADAELASRVRAGMRRAAEYYREKVASHGGYVYHYSLDPKQRWGEGVATADQIWVQPPGTPTVGLAYLAAYRATGDNYYLSAATVAAEALVYGQVQSGGWTNCIDFDPKGSRVSLYRNGRGRGRNISSLDDGQTQSAIRCLIQVDGTFRFRHKQIHEAAQAALEALLKAQFPNGAFPQVWDEKPAPRKAPLPASYPEYDWRTEGRVKNYWDMYTLNDNVAGYVAQTLLDAHAVYGDERYLQALRRLGDFLIAAQMPDPQPGWAQQYSYEMKPIWARKFEPPAVAGDETQEAMATLMNIYCATGDKKYLAPIPKALAWLKGSRLPDGHVARYYELQTNRPLYMNRQGKSYVLTYDDSQLPSHYGWKIESRLAELTERYQALLAHGPTKPSPPQPKRAETEKILASLDEQGRWVSTYDGERLVGQPKFPVGYRYLSSECFADNLTALASFLQSDKPQDR
jgi:PelA/Pel-15E family pectate lyase